jgi:hypothetical protein
VTGLPWFSLDQSERDWLKRENVLDAALGILPQVGAATVKFGGKLFAQDPEGERALTFVIHDCEQFIDFAAWHPRTQQLATWRGAGFAIGQDAIFNPASYFDGGALRVHSNRISWLRANRNGIVICAPEITNAHLASVPRLLFADPAHARRVRRWLSPPQPRTELLIDAPAEKLAA